MINLARHNPPAVSNASSRTTPTGSRRFRRVISDTESEGFDSVYGESDATYDAYDSDVSVEVHSFLGADSDTDIDPMHAGINQWSSDEEDEDDDGNTLGSLIARVQLQRSIASNGQSPEIETAIQIEGFDFVYGERDATYEAYDSDVSVEVHSFLGADSDTDIDLMHVGLNQWSSDDEDEDDDGNTIGSLIVRVQLQRSMKSNGQSPEIETVIRVRISERRHVDITNPFGITDDDQETSPFVGHSGDYLDARSFEELLERADHNGLACAICKDLLTVGNVVNWLLCLHLYHPSCIKLWLSNRNTRPLCQFEVPANDDTSFEERKGEEVLNVDGGRRRGAGRWLYMATPVVTLVGIGLALWLGNPRAIQGSGSVSSSGEKSNGGVCKEEDDKEEEICPSCCDEYQAHQMIRTLACRHSYHEVCIKNWLSRKKILVDTDIDLMHAGLNQWSSDDENEDDDGNTLDSLIARVQLQISMTSNGQSLEIETAIRVRISERRHVDKTNPFGIIDDDQATSPFVGHYGDYLDAKSFEELLERLAKADNSRRDPSPAALSFVNNLERIVVNSVDHNGLACAICKDLLTVRNVVNRLLCLHLYHPSCIKLWLDVSFEESKVEEVLNVDGGRGRGSGRWLYMAAPVVTLVGIGLEL
uniref:RING-type E3 ubiquitin transferase n=1 Tax=Tanacetum cinerariifolium TaxID=118510 RepID=A0A6L2P6Q7_TANCI|nr:hypothetical protein [Tanacetum cinerariifolium]